MLEQMLGSAASNLRSLAAFTAKPDLADDTFLLAGRALHYCPASIATSALLPSLLESATQGLLVQHRSALISCSSPPVSVVQIMAIANGDFRRLWCTQLLAGTGLCT